MNADIVITQEGAHPDDWDDAQPLYLNGEDDPDQAAEIASRYSKVIITFSGGHDGRGFSLARHLRDQGYTGHLRARGPLVPDQWRHLRQTGFDDLILTSAQVEKMPLESWQDVQRLVLPDYQQRIFTNP